VEVCALECKGKIEKFKERFREATKREYTQAYISVVEEWLSQTDGQR